MAEDFWVRYNKAKESGVFYFWGHSYEMFRYDEMWNHFEAKIRYITEDPEAEWANDPEANTQIVGNDIPEGWMGLDIGPKTIELYSNAIKNAKTVVWNGPMGCFEMEKFNKGTFGVCAAVAEVKANGGISIIGGGDSVSAVKKSGKAAEMSHISTGGGASLEFLEGKELPGVAALADK